MNKALSFVLAAAFSVGTASAVSAQQIDIDLGALTGMTGDQVGSFVNIAVNNAAIDGSVVANFSATAFLEATSDATAGSGSATANSTASSAVAGALGDVDTTVIGAVNEGSVTIGVADILDNASAGAANAASDYVGPLKDTIAANLAFNQFDLNASASVTALNYALDAGGVATTAIGAVNTGSITAGVQGSLADIHVAVE